MRNLIMVIIIAVAFTFALAGCGEAEVPPETQVNAEPQVLSDEIIEHLYLRAWTLYSWFALTTIPYIDFEDSAPSDDWWGSRVTHETFTTMGTLQSALEALFAPDIVDELLALDRFREYDGILYTIAADRGTRIDLGEETHEIIRVSTNEIIYRVTVEVLGYDDVEVSDFHLVYTYNNWIFNNFHLVR